MGKKEYEWLSCDMVLGSSASWTEKPERVCPYKCAEIARPSGFIRPLTKSKKKRHRAFADNNKQYLNRVLAVRCPPHNPACDFHAPHGVFTQAVNSDFCLEPPGDTPTRSHFYVAILSGCIPVIFDGEPGYLFPWQSTNW